MDAARNIILIILFVIVIVAIIKLLGNDDEKIQYDTDFKLPKEPYLFTHENMKSRLRKQILETTDFDSCISLLAEYSSLYNISRNPKDYLLFKNHLDAITQNEKQI